MSAAKLLPHYDPETGLVKVSWSKVRTSEECRQKAYLIAGGHKSPITDVRVFFQGNVVDQAMRRWLSMDNPRPGWMADHVGEILDEVEREVLAEGDGVVRWKHRDDRREVRDFCTEAAYRLEFILKQLVMPYEYQPAVRFQTKLTIPGLDGEPTPILLVGEMDVLVRCDPPLQDITVDADPVVVTMASKPQLRVYDLKITKSADYWRKTEAQLTFYDLACWCMFGVTTSEVGLLQPMVEGVPFMQWSRSNEDRTQMLTRIITVAHNIMRGDATPKADSAGCSYCEVRHACAKYALVPGTNQVNLF